MSKNKGGKPINNRRKKSPNNGTLAHFFKDFRDLFDEEFFRKFYDEEDEKREKFLEAYELTCGNVSASCRASDIPRRTFYNWMKSKAPRDTEFRRRLEEVKPGERLFDMAELVVWQHLNMGNLQAAIFVLTKNRFAYSRGYQQKPPETESLIEREYQQLRRLIQKVAIESGVDYFTELKDYIHEFGDILNKEILEKLQQELDK